MRFDVPKGLGFVSKSAQRIGKQDSDVDDSWEYNYILNLHEITLKYCSNTTTSK